VISVDDQMKNEEQMPQEQNASGAVVPEQVKPAGSANYASVLTRFVAGLIDALLIGVVSGILAFILGAGRSDFGTNVSNPFNILALIYFVYMTKVYGATLGKRAVGIKVQKLDGTEITWVDAILREVVGKFVSGLVFLLGYFWAIWDPQKQTWHDKIANTIVVKE
jgi:uncharacterized RDD family membrane protein YckC